MAMPKISIGYVCGPGVDQPFMDSIFRLLTFDNQNRKIIQGMGFIKGLYVDDNRNNLAREFLKTDADYLLMLDTDMEFSPEVPYVLLDDMLQNDRAIESALYFGILHGQMKPVWFIEGDKAKGERSAVKNIGKLTLGTVVPIAAVGMGCCLIRRDVFEKMAAVPEYAADSWTFFPRHPVVVDGVIQREGEDIGFCLRAKELGFQTWGNATVEAGHWKKMRLDFQLFRVMYEAAQREGRPY